MNNDSEVLKMQPVLFCKKRWGYYQLYESFSVYQLDNRNQTSERKVKIKILTFNPKKENEKWDENVNHLSFQRHNKRHEAWRLIAGRGILILRHADMEKDKFLIYCLGTDRTIEIPPGTWHTCFNVERHIELKVLELQQGEVCEEDDIERETINPKIYNLVEEESKIEFLNRDIVCVGKGYRL